MTGRTPPLWLLAELTYRCPLQCPYCSNPLNFHTAQNELDTEQWSRVLHQARQLGAAQLGFSGGEPLVRQDLTQLIGEARRLGYYTNLITSGLGMDAERVHEFRQAGLDHIQISFQGSSAEQNNHFAGSGKAFEQKIRMAEAVKGNGYPMVLNFVLHRHNIDQVDQMLELALQLRADYVELANAQYYGWAHLNREQLLPSREQLQRAEAITQRFRERVGPAMRIIFVVPDYYEQRPKPCMNGWGNIFLTITPDGTALPCHSAGSIPMAFPNVREHQLAWIWQDSPAFNAFRGLDWMREPCRSCPERELDFGGCRCQALLLTGDAYNTDPVCTKSPHHHIVTEAVAIAQCPEHSRRPLLFRNVLNARQLIARG